jgi:hypothetical protein
VEAHTPGAEAALGVSEIETHCLNHTGSPAAAGLSVRFASLAPRATVKPPSAI